MGRDTTASKRMAAKRGREKAAGLRRLNIALKPEVFGKLAELMKRHNCTSQAGLIELLVMDISAVSSSRHEETCNEVTAGKAMAKRKPLSIIQHPKSQKPAKAPENKTKVVTTTKELATEQMSLFES
ncbi:MAG: hypothetical protein WCD00_01125 [Desulfuromonadaceae bacterium]